MAGELKKKSLNRKPDQEKEPPREEDKAAGRQRAGSGTPTAGKAADAKTAEGKTAPEAAAPMDQQSEGAPDGRGSEDGAPERQNRGGGRRKLVFIAAPAALLLVIASGLLFFKFGSLGGSPDSESKLEPVTSLTRPIPIPEYREMLDFLILNEMDGQKTLTSFRMEFTFHSPSCYQSFKERNVPFRDAVYSFLQKQNTLKNTGRTWQTVVEKDLYEYIRATLPLSRADSVRLTQVVNL